MNEYNHRLPILVVEDSDEDFDVLKITFNQYQIGNPVHRAVDCREVFELLARLQSKDEELPGLIILDLNLIGVDGREVLRRLKLDPTYRRIPVIIFSTSSSPKDIELCYAEGAASYSMKPVSLERLEEFVLSLRNFWLKNSLLPRRSELDRLRAPHGQT